MISRHRLRLPMKLIGTWAAIFAGGVSVWLIHAYAMSEPEQTFFLNILQSNVSFLAQLAVGGAVLTVVVSEISRLAVRWGCGE